MEKAQVYLDSPRLSQTQHNFSAALMLVHMPPISLFKFQT
jgi:hypothetical protein